MAGRFISTKFSEIDLQNSFFDSLKLDYPEFEQWFRKKATEGRPAVVFEDELGVAAFVAVKTENEVIQTTDTLIPSEKRMKICTLKISERHRGERYGEGAIGLTLWAWQKTDCNEIYVTIFDKHKDLVSQIERFGFQKRGYNQNGEGIYIKDRRSIDYSDPYKSFPFINPNFAYGGYIIINQEYHDTMFAYSELANNKTDTSELVGNTVINGLSKIYVGSSPVINHKVGEPIFIYRRDTQNMSGKKYRSCITSYAVVTDVMQAKANGKPLMLFDDVIQRIGNKTVFDKAELERQYNENWNVSIVEMLYYGFFGAGNNVTMDWLEKNGCWASSDMYPTEVHLSKDQFKKILTEGNINVSDVIID